MTISKKIKERLLVSLSEYVLYKQREINKLYGMNWTKELDLQKSHRFDMCVCLAEFLKQNLKLWMVIGCDEEGNILEIPLDFLNQTSPLHVPEKVHQYKKAQERCLFEGFEVSEKNEHGLYLKDKNGVHIFYDAKGGFHHTTVEQLTQIADKNVTLTEKVANELGYGVQG